MKMRIIKRIVVGLGLSILVGFIIPLSIHQYACYLIEKGFSHVKKPDSGSINTNPPGAAFYSGWDYLSVLGYFPFWSAQREKTKKYYAWHSSQVFLNVYGDRQQILEEKLLEETSTEWYKRRTVAAVNKLSFEEVENLHVVFKESTDSFYNWKLKYYTEGNSIEELPAFMQPTAKALQDTLKPNICNKWVEYMAWTSSVVYCVDLDNICRYSLPSNKFLSDRRLKIMLKIQEEILKHTK